MGGLVRTDLLGHERRPTRRGLRHHHRWSLPCRQASGRAEEQEMEAQLCVDIHSSHASIQEEGRVVPVLGGHCGRLWAVSFACMLSDWNSASTSFIFGSPPDHTPQGQQVHPNEHLAWASVHVWNSASTSFIFG